MISHYFSWDWNHGALNETIKQQVKDKWKKTNKTLAHVVPNCIAGLNILFYNILICLDALTINKFWKLLDGFLEERSVKDS